MNKWRRKADIMVVYWVLVAEKQIALMRLQKRLDN